MESAVERVGDNWCWGGGKAKGREKDGGGKRGRNKTGLDIKGKSHFSN